MEELKKILVELLNKSNNIHWFIVHDLSKTLNHNSDIEFSFIDGAIDREEPFNKNLGYITIKDESKFEELIKELIIKFKAKEKQLSNIFIIIFRLNKSTLIEKIISSIKELLTEEILRSVYNLLIQSLNENYYSHIIINKTAPICTNDWLDLFTSAQYYHTISDPLMCLILFAEIDEQKIDFSYIQIMSPLLRSIIIGKYGWNIKISTSEVLNLIEENETEASFFSAYLLDDMLPEQKAPDWLSRDIVDVFISKYWNNIGSQTFQHIYGVSHRNKNDNMLYEKFCEYYHEVLLNKIKDDKKDNSWILSLTFPDGFISLFYWMYKKPDVLKTHITDLNQTKITTRLISEFKRIVDNASNYISSEHRINPFNNYKLNNNKYTIALSYALIFILNAEDKFIDNDLKSILHKIKPLFYGGYASTTFAKDSIGILFIICLSSININGSNKEMENKLKLLISILKETVLIPYIHLIERENVIWDITDKDSQNQYNIGILIINNYLKEINKNKTLKELYKDIFDVLEDVKVAKWLYER